MRYVNEPQKHYLEASKDGSAAVFSPIIAPSEDTERRKHISLIA
jgi:hypothetical protein